MAEMVMVLDSGQVRWWAPKLSSDKSVTAS